MLDSFLVDDANVGGVYYTDADDYLVYHAFGTTEAQWMFLGATTYDPTSGSTWYELTTSVDVYGPSGNVTREVFVGFRRLGDGDGDADRIRYYQAFIVWGRWTRQKGGGGVVLGVAGGNWRGGVYSYESFFDLSALSLPVFFPIAPPGIENTASLSGIQEAANVADIRVVGVPSGSDLLFLTFGSTTMYSPLQFVWFARAITTTRADNAAYVVSASYVNDAPAADVVVDEVGGSADADDLIVSDERGTVYVVNGAAYAWPRLMGYWTFF